MQVFSVKLLDAQSLDISRFFLLRLPFISYGSGLMYMNFVIKVAKIPLELVVMENNDNKPLLMIPEKNLIVSN